MSYCVQLIIEAFMLFTTGLAVLVFLVALAWRFWYYVVACKHPLGATVLTSMAALWLICAGAYAII